MEKGKTKRVNVWVCVYAGWPGAGQAFFCLANSTCDRWFAHSSAWGGKAVRRRSETFVSSEYRLTFQMLRLTGRNSGRSALWDISASRLVHGPMEIESADKDGTMLNLRHRGLLQLFIDGASVLPNVPFQARASWWEQFSSFSFFAFE